MKAHLVEGSGHEDTLNEAIHAALGTPIEGDDRGAAKRRADALVDVARFFLDHEDLPVEAGEAPHVSVVIDWNTITASSPSAKVTAMVGPALSPSQLHELLCDCKISRIVLGPDSQPLDVGREERTASRAQRRALGRLDQGCRFPGL